ncbi:MAG: hypothetical protein NDJ92_19920, partial [Thermoanaerobaculia bacterium]|nr:hypothetical protein [Thermoanaerobaculia bacterium]
MPRHRTPFAAAAFAMLLACSAGAGTFIIPDDDTLVRRARSIVTGTVLDSRSELTPAGGVRTVTELWVSRVLAGRHQPGAILSI